MRATILVVQPAVARAGEMGMYAAIPKMILCNSEGLIGAKSGSSCSLNQLAGPRHSGLNHQYCGPS